MGIKRGYTQENVLIRAKQCTSVYKGQVMYKTPNVGFVEMLGQMIMVDIDDGLLAREEADGLYHGEKITLKSYYSTKKDFIRVLAHESFHALCEALGCQLNLQMEETLAHRVSIMMAEMYEERY